jgi:hypothetical protein
MIQGDAARWPADQAIEVRGDDAARALASTGTLEPGEQFFGVADRGRESDPLDWVSGQPFEAFEYGE